MHACNSLICGVQDFKSSSYPLMHLCSYGSMWAILGGKFIPVKNKKQLMYEQKNTNGEWDLVTNIEGHTSWYRQNRLLHRILIYQYFFFIENLVRLEVNRFIFRAIVSIPTAYLIQRIKNWHLIGTANQSVWHPSSALSLLFWAFCGCGESSRGFYVRFIESTKLYF